MSILSPRKDNAAPCWQPQGVGWETIPFVPYDSFMECRLLLKVVFDEYSSMMWRGLEIGNMQLWSIAAYGLSQGVKRHWMMHGVNIILKLTKGIGREWCESVNLLLVNSLNTAARVFVFSRVPFPVTGFGDFRDYVHDVFDILERELSIVLHSWDIGPFGSYSFYLVNFKYYRSISSDTSDSEDNDLFYMPIGKFQDIMTAFVMGMHQRLGANSECVVGLLNDEIFKCIFSHGIF